MKNFKQIAEEAPDTKVISYTNKGAEATLRVNINNKAVKVLIDQDLYYEAWTEGRFRCGRIARTPRCILDALRGLVGAGLPEGSLRPYVGV